MGQPLFFIKKLLFASDGMTSPNITQESRKSQYCLKIYENVYLAYVIFSIVYVFFVDSNIILEPENPPPRAENGRESPGFPGVTVGTWVVLTASFVGVGPV